MRQVERDATNSYSAHVGHNLRVVRAMRDIGQEAVAAKMRAAGFAGWVRQTVSQVERGRRRLTVDEVGTLSSQLGVPLGDLLGYDLGSRRNGDTS